MRTERFSSLKLAVCPLAYKSYHSGAPTTLPSEAAQGGTERHAMIAEALQGRANAKEGWSRNLSAKLKRFIERSLVIDCLAESRFEIDLLDSKLQGTRDAVSISGNRAVIVDWKSYSEGDEDQLDIYAMSLLFTHPEVEEVEACFYYVPLDYHGEWKSYTRDDLKKIFNAVLDRMKAAKENEDGPPCPGPHCRWCNYTHLCPVIHEFVPMVIESKAMAAESGRKIYAVEAALSQAKKAMREWMIENDCERLDLGDGFDYRLTHVIMLKSGKPRKGRKKEEDEE